MKHVNFWVQSVFGSGLFAALIVAAFATAILL